MRWQKLKYKKNFLWSFNSQPADHQWGIKTITLKNQLWREDTEELSSVLYHILLVILELN